MKRTERNRGLVLVMVLWIVAIMTAIIAVVSQTSRLDMKMATATADEVRCKWACRAGTENAIAILAEDLRDTDCLQDLWSDNEEAFTEVSLEGCTYDVQVTDEAGKLNVNTITRDQLMALPYMESQIADAILDWRDRNEEPRAEGVESGYYGNLPIPYTARNGPFRTVRELLKVKGVTEDLLYGEDTNLNGLLDYNEQDGELSPPRDNGDDYLDEGWFAYLTCYSYERNVDGAGNRRVNINEADERRLASELQISDAHARWIVQNRGDGYDSIADVLGDNDSGQSQNGSDQAQPLDRQTFSQIVDKITISNDESIPGKVNINTAPQEVLRSLFGGDDEAEQLAYTVIADRASLLYGMESIAELLDKQSMTTERFKRIADRITVRSDVFTIRCVATADVSGARLETECVVDRGATPASILYHHQGANY